MLEKMYRLQQRFKEVYQEGPLLGVSDHDMHVASEFFLEKFDDYEILDFDSGSNYPVKLIAEFKDVQVMTLLDHEQYEEVKNERACQSI